MNTSKTRLTLLGIAFGILLALLLAPQTRWLVRLQFLPLSLVPTHYDQQRLAFVQHHPNDYQIQLAGQPDSIKQNQVEYARSLVSRFPNSASIRATILRSAMFDDFHVSSDADYLLGGQPPPANRPSNAPPSPAQFSAFDADAAAGERLDPDNAYFPFMRSVGYFSVHRDAEGLAAVQRAAKKHVWREYFEDGVEGRWRINDAVYGGREAISASAISASVLFPHYASLRAVARIVAYHAILEEQAGHQEEGLAEREALGRCGELMMTQSTTIIGSLVGAAINMISRTRPGGALPLKSDPNMPGDQIVQRRLDLYCAYVTKIGHPEAAAQAQADFQKWQQMHRTTAKIGDYAFGNSVSDAVRLGIALVAGWAVLANVLGLLAVGLVAAGLAHLPRVQRREPLPAGAAIGFWSVVLITLVLVAVFLSSDNSTFWLFTSVLVLVSLGAAALAALFRPRLRRSITMALLTAGITLAAISLLGVLMVWQTHGWSDFAASFRQMSPQSSDPNSAATSGGTEAQVQLLLICTVGLALPLLVAIVLSIVSRVKRVPVSVGLASGFRAVMPPLVCALMLVYGGLTLWTVQQEARANYGLERSLHGEGQHLAEVTGQAWPKE